MRDRNELLATGIPDVQGSRDRRQMPIQRVGVRDVRFPTRWRGADGEQPSVAVASLYVALPAEQKGTHMSRFLELLDTDGGLLDCPAVRDLHRRMLERLEATDGSIELRMPYFVRKAAPVSGVRSLMDYEIRVSVEGGREHARLRLTVLVPVTSLCPCSKTISDYGAHNQRSHVTVTVSGEVLPDPAALIALVESEASCDLYGVLKRVDEKFVTERAYDNPKFVEDLVRDVAARVRAIPGVADYAVEAENFESIHNHSAYARLEGSVS